MAMASGFVYGDGVEVGGFDQSPRMLVVPELQVM